MNANTKKISYIAPAVKVVAFKVEQGFAGTETIYVGDGNKDPQPTQVEQGTETFTFGHF